MTPISSLQSHPHSSSVSPSELWHGEMGHWVSKITQGKHFSSKAKEFFLSHNTSPNLEFSTSGLRKLLDCFELISQAIKERWLVPVNGLSIALIWLHASHSKICSKFRVKRTEWEGRGGMHNTWRGCPDQTQETIKYEYNVWHVQWIFTIVHKSFFAQFSNTD